MTMNNQQARVIDPILSNVARGYRNAQYVGEALFPRVPVQTSGGQVLEFGKEAFRLYNSRRAPGAGTKRVQFGYLGKPFALQGHSLEGVVPMEHQRDAARVPGVDLGSRSIRLVMNSMLLELEAQQASLAINPANYAASNKETLAGADKWTADTGKPSRDIEEAKEAVRSQIGIYPNTALLSAKAFKAAKNNPSIVERFKYTSKDSITADMLAALWEVDKVVVGGAVAMGADDAMADLWGTSVVLAYTAVGAEGAEEPSFGYTYTMEGQPAVEEPYYDRNAKSWIYPSTLERAPVIAGADAGFLLSGVV